MSLPDFVTTNLYLPSLFYLGNDFWPGHILTVRKKIRMKSLQDGSVRFQTWNPYNPAASQGQMYGE